MNNQRNQLSFEFSPTQLYEEMKLLEKEFKNTDEIPESKIQVKLPRLLLMIRKLNNDESEIIQFAHTLKPIDINILASEYPYEQENKATVQKILLILTTRYNGVVGRHFWNHLQIMPHDLNVISLLKVAFKTESMAFLNLKGHIRLNYGRCFEREKVLINIAIMIGEEKRNLHDSFSDWKITENSPLALLMWRYIIVKHLKDKWFLERNESSLIVNHLERLGLDSYKKVISTYLNHYNFKQYNSNFLRQVIQRLGDPRTHPTTWRSFSSHANKQVIKWLYKRDLFEFLELERFDYWKKYLDHVTDLEVIKQPPVAALYFDDFVALEFAEFGNAAYFYKSQEFLKYLSPKLRHNILESELKQKDAPFFIHKLNHSKDHLWHRRFDHYMTQFLNGNFNIYK